MNRFLFQNALRLDNLNEMEAMTVTHVCFIEGYTSPKAGG